MPLIVWTDRMSVGVKLLDNDHKKLVLLINELHNGIMTGRAKPALNQAFEKLVRYTRVHFAHEEHLLAETGYTGATANKQEHDRMVELLRGLQALFGNAKEIAAELEVMHQIKSWLFSHMQSSDQEYVPHLKAKGVDSILAAWNGPDGVAQQRPAIGAGAGQA